MLAERFKWQTYVSDYFEVFPWTLIIGMLCNHNLSSHEKKWSNYLIFMKSTLLDQQRRQIGVSLSWQKPNWPQFAQLNSTNFCVCVKNALFDFWKQTWDYLLMKLNQTTFLGIFCKNTLRLFVISDFFIFSDCRSPLSLVQTPSFCPFCFYSKLIIISIMEVCIHTNSFVKL